MVTVFCAIVGVAGSVFSVKIDENESVAGLKKAIKKENPNTFQCDAMDLQLFLTKKDNVWLTEAHVKEGVSDTSGFKLLDAMKMKLKAVGLKDENDEEEYAEGEGIVDVLVVIPQERSFQSFQTQLDFIEAVPSDFQTLRPALVDSFMNLLFPSSGEYRPLLFIRAPPLSGKSTLCDLLCDRLVKTKPGVLVARVLASRKPSSVSFSDNFKSVYNCVLDKFWDFPCDRVLFIDEAQLVYDDDYLWLGLLKNTYERRFPGPRIVLFSSYGGGQHERSGMDFAIDRCDTFGLTGRGTTLELKLSRAELDEMIGDSIFAKVGDLIWDLSSAHIGIAHATLTFLAEEFKNKLSDSIDASEMALVLRSVGLLNFIREKRGIPTVDAFERVVEQENVPKESWGKYGEMRRMLDNLTRGEVVISTDCDRPAVEFLTKFGFLYEDENKQLRFASSMHTKIWLYSLRPSPLQKVLDFSQDDFVAACTKRMWAGALQRYVTANTCNSTRERHMQLELYDATVRCLPRDVLVTPGCRTNDGKGFNDLVIRGPSVFWLWELLVNEDDVFAPTKRFETLGKRYGSFSGSFKYVLIDFRQNKRVGHEKDGFLYVSFEDSYKKALISGLGKPVTTVELSGR